jgi:26S proteasome regulatory subunit N7
LANTHNTPPQHYPDKQTKTKPQELAEFIVAGRLGAKIDKVSGVVESRRPDARAAAYHDVLKRGDLLLARVQKLSRVADVE